MIRSFIAFFSSLLLYLFTIFNKLLLSVKLYFVYIFLGEGGGGERGKKRGNFLRIDLNFDIFKLNAAWLDTDHPKRMAALNSAVADDRMTSQYKQLLQIASNN